MNKKCLMCGTVLTVKQKQFCSVQCKSKSQIRKVEIDTTKLFRCKLTGKTVSLGSKMSGYLTKYSKTVLNKEYDSNDWEIIDNIITVVPTMSCPICMRWSTKDVQNKSGCLTAHINKEHKLNIDEFCTIYPEFKHLWSIHWKKQTYNEELNIPDNNIQCLECGKLLKKITCTHLKKHNMSNSQYSDKYGVTNLSSLNTRKKLQVLYANNDNLLDTNWNSKGQIEIQTFINDLGFKTVIRRKDHVELDIFIPEKNIAIEYNGLYWHSEFHGKKNKLYHVHKTDYCEKNGIHLIHVFEDEWYNKNDIIKSRIKNILGINTERIYARQCTIQPVSGIDKKEFLDLNHIQGHDNSSYSIGLFYKTDLVSIMTFRKPLVSMGHKNTANNIIELSRFCSRLNTNVIGAADKLFKYFLKNNTEYDTIISYADRRWTTTIRESVYDKLGFVNIGKSNPNYWYMKRHKIRLSRFNYTKNAILDKFPTTSPELTEWENMLKLGYDRIWDCGTLKYKYDVKNN